MDKFNYKIKNLKIEPFNLIQDFIEKKLDEKYGISDSQLENQLTQIDLDITQACNLQCFNCNQQCSQAVDSDHITIKQVQKFFLEVNQLNWKFKRISIIGGEPTIHPQFFKILDIIKPYKEKNPDCLIKLFTNGYGEYVQQILTKIPEWVFIRNDHKTTKEQKFICVNQAPIDFDEHKNKDFSKGCFAPWQYGMHFSKYGFHPCCASPGIDRVFGLNLGIKTLKEVTPENLIKLFPSLCKYCGYMVNNESKIQQTSKTWIDAINKYHISKPIMELYG